METKPAVKGYINCQSVRERVVLVWVGDEGNVQPSNHIMAGR